jgi:hypothetical protein
MWGVSEAGEDSGIRIAKKTGNVLLNWFKQFLP